MLSRKRRRSLSKRAQGKITPAHLWGDFRKARKGREESAPHAKRDPRRADRRKVAREAAIKTAKAGLIAPILRTRKLALNGRFEIAGDAGADDLDHLGRGATTPLGCLAVGLALDDRR